ncbi:nucleoside 2-deoxyribosyltransferase [Paenibacillus sp. V4I9]|uniref:nucleoside 2-deoxyribosyltransferase n=1 Tax=Paenibacillus sp. V4I9 TaxID=3042308 RepID=UPI002787AD74|nr:nucleoside 2-deoxyribosyltransferase [Paenibacillus sp. V4I9]MDQ0888577.1 nucleoside 2-deoxyribosyltransferase [Paenibacillus sp. V4I9]
MKFYIASSLRNVGNVRDVAEVLKSRGFAQTYDWTTHSKVDSISKLREIGNEEVAGVLDADVVIIMMPAGKGSHVELGIALGTKKKIYLYSSTHEINDIGTTSTFYHLDEVEQCIGSLEYLISTISMSHTPTSLN